jgi:carbon storage regulator
VLVLSRKESQRLVIGDNIVVTVVKLAGGKCQIGVEAPKDVRVVRADLLDVVKASRERFEGKQ